MNDFLKISRADLEKCGAEELSAIFAQLPAPAMQEMDGEYDATLLQQPSSTAKLFARLVLANPAWPWQCKAFRPLNEDLGRGYNIFRLMGRDWLCFPMQTLIAPSRFDGKPAYQLVYRAYHSITAAMHVVDEIRRVNAKLYLGLGTWGFSDRQRQKPMPFLLEATTRQYRSDVGSEREGFVLSTEIPALRHTDCRP